jgi:predicted  nucleic acid-binding Zn-ribbon protein
VIANQFSAINLQLENQAKMIRNIHTQLSTLQNAIAAVQHQAANNIPPRVQTFCDEVSNHMAAYQREQGLAAERIRGLGNTLTTITGNVQKHVANSDNNFRETAMHMDSVKKRFAEHRKQLDNLITAWRETMLTTDELTVKFESLKEFLSVKVVPTIGKWSKVVPGLIEGNIGDAGGAPIVQQSSIGSTANPTTMTRDTGSRNVSTRDGDGGANNPIEL